MDAASVAFLATGAVGLLILVVSLVVGELGELGPGDADGPFSVPALAALLGGVGFGGAAALALLPEALPGVARVLLALLSGLAVAGPLAWGALRLSRGLRDMPTGETLTRAHLTGTQGVVITPVPAQGFGEVRLVVGGQQLKFSARSDVPLPLGTPVYVTDALSDTAVEVVSTAPDPLPRPFPEPGGDPT